MLILRGNNTRKKKIPIHFEMSKLTFLCMISLCSVKPKMKHRIGSCALILRFSWIQSIILGFAHNRAFCTLTAERRELWLHRHWTVWSCLSLLCYLYTDTVEDVVQIFLKMNMVMARFYFNNNLWSGWLWFIAVLTWALLPFGLHHLFCSSSFIVQVVTCLLDTSLPHLWCQRDLQTLPVFSIENYSEHFANLKYLYSVLIFQTVSQCLHFLRISPSILHSPSLPHFLTGSV